MSADRDGQDDRARLRELSAQIVWHRSVVASLHAERNALVTDMVDSRVPYRDIQEDSGLSAIRISKMVKKVRDERADNAERNARNA